MKFHSSIFSFDTLQGNPLRILCRPAVIIVLVLLLLVELTVRLSIPDRRVPKGGFHSAELRQSVDQLKQLQDVDLFITGSSIAAVNISPEVFDPQIQSHGFDGFTSFNAGIRGCNFLCIKPSLEKLFLSRKIPNIVLILLSPSDLDAANHVVIDRSIKRAEALKQPYYLEIARNLLSSMSWIYGFDAEIRALLDTRTWVFDTAQITVRGHIDMGSEPQRRHIWDFQLDADGEITQAFYKLLHNLTSRGVSVILLPVVGDSTTRNNFNPSDRQDFSAIIEKALTNDLVRLVRVDEDLSDDENYIDNLHLNTKSAKIYSRQIADALVDQGFPWDINLSN